MIHDPRCGTVLAAIYVLAAIGCSDDDGASSKQDPDPIESVRAMVEKYRAGVAVAEADGYAAAGDCVESPEGGMGVHYLNPSKLMAPPRADDPPILLYVPSAEGLVLAGVEYMQPIMQDGAPYVAPETEPPRADSVGTAPVLFDGHPFDGPMPGHEPGMPWHYDQHVWLFVENPSGMFSAWNPAVSCL
jgi:hypothetical protein